jgi:hypothetical protein
MGRSRRDGSTHGLIGEGTNLSLENNAIRVTRQGPLRRQMILKRNTFIGCFANAISNVRTRPRASVLLLMLVSLSGLVRSSHAQARATAEKAGGLDAFGALNITGTDHTDDTDVGVAVGGAVRMRKFFFGQPAFAGRYSYMHGSTANEYFVGGGGELHYRFSMLRPYITILGGVQGLSIPSVHYSDSGNTLLVGGGTDIPINLRFAARAEFNYAFDNITGYHNTSVGQINLNPWSINLGVVYRIK